MISPKDERWLIDRFNLPRYLLLTALPERQPKNNTLHFSLAQTFTRDFTDGPIDEARCAKPRLLFIVASVSQSRGRTLLNTSHTHISHTRGQGQLFVWK